MYAPWLTHRRWARSLGQAMVEEYGMAGIRRWGAGAKRISCRSKSRATSSTIFAEIVLLFPTNAVISACSQSKLVIRGMPPACRCTASIASGPKISSPVLPAIRRRSLTCPCVSTSVSGPVLAQSVMRWRSCRSCWSSTSLPAQINRRERSEVELLVLLQGRCRSLRQRGWHLVRGRYEIRRCGGGTDDHRGRISFDARDVSAT